MVVVFFETSVFVGWLFSGVTAAFRSIRGPLRNLPRQVLHLVFEWRLPDSQLPISLFRRFDIRGSYPDFLAHSPNSHSAVAGLS